MDLNELLALRQQELEKFNCFQRCQYRIEWYHHSHSRLLLSSREESDIDSENKVYLLLTAVYFASTIPRWNNHPLKLINGNDSLSFDKYLKSKRNIAPIILGSALPSLSIYFACAYMRFSTEPID